MDGWLDGLMGRWMDGCMVGGWIGGLEGGWMDGW